jgi:hypothetical protein
VDGSSISHNNIADIKYEMPISVANLQVSIMTNSDIYNLDTREFIGVKFSLHER